MAYKNELDTPSWEWSDRSKIRELVEDGASTGEDHIYVETDQEDEIKYVRNLVARKYREVFSCHLFRGNDGKAEGISLRRKSRPVHPIIGEELNSMAYKAAESGVSISELSMVKRWLQNAYNEFKQATVTGQESPE